MIIRTPVLKFIYKKKNKYGEDVLKICVKYYIIRKMFSFVLHHYFFTCYSTGRSF